MENQIRKTITTVGGLTICTLLGVALRFWIRDWANFVTPDGNTGNIVFGLIYVQVLGCLIMGFLVYSKPKFVEISESYYIGLTVGFCGSLTTFSSWQTDISLVIFGFGEINASLTGVQKVSKKLIQRVI
ncbi:UPF0695 membrane protein [Zancudomyces culisetae]|uniref:UPF0695 membrane protein n=1 Tax=Zancudomyces culisetae TaxID=1213189 RepID=A0A1R1PU05_ZANCU|nr:UPF0695 membrane protein [Zancudomyces culisetae]|eukprot:OMH84399.1 UPF0695 membrane protein [Zancudomyces culisetae]